jgi:hypothetical protein
MKCLKCNKEHDGSFGSGKYCSIQCSNSRPRPPEVREKIGNKLRIKRDEISCLTCGKKFIPRRKTSKFCSRLCSRRHSIVYAKKSQMENPPNWSEIHKQSYRKGNNFVAGGTVKWLPYKDIKVQGSYELRMCHILDTMADCGDIKEWSYATDRIPYLDAEGSKRTYIIDFKVVNKDDSFYYIETKGYVKENDHYKWKAAKDLGLTLVVAQQKDIEQLEKKYALIV